MAAREINASGGVNGRQIKLRVVDDATSLARSAIVMRGIFMALRFIDPIKSKTPEPFDLYGMVLAGIGLAGIAFGLSVAGFNLLP